MITNLTHKYVKDPRGKRQREIGEEDGEEPGGGVHGGMKALSLKMYIQLWELLLLRRQVHIFTVIERCLEPEP